MRRRHLTMGLVLAALAPGAFGQGRPPQFPDAARVTVARRRFLGWLRSLERAGAHGLYPYMSGPGAAHLSGLSPMASADLAVWALRTGEVDLGLRIASGLAHWQREVERSMPARVHGGLPSDLARDSAGWRPGTAYYAGDNLLCMAALCRAHAASGKEEYAVAALKIARWMRATLLDGRRAGLWARNYGPPMHYMTADGAYDNTIHTAVDYLWLGALREVSELDKAGGWLAMEAEASSFLADAQSRHGSWYSYFQPDTPRTAAGRWHWYRGTDVALGDDGLRATLAALRYGRSGQVQAYLQWLQPAEGVYVHGYLDPRTGSPKFLRGDAPYFDMVCTGLLKALHERLGRMEESARCEAAMLQWQANDGGWHWGRRQGDMQPLKDEEALITAVWAMGSSL